MGIFARLRLAKIRTMARPHSPERRQRQRKRHLKNKHLRNGDYFAIVAFCSRFKFLTNYAKNEPVRAP